MATTRVRLGVLVMVAASVGGAQLASSADAGGDARGSMRAQARRIADELDRLETREAVLGEDFDQAQLAQAGLERKIGVAERQATSTGHEVARRRAALRRYAVSAYTSGAGDGPLQMVLHGRGTDLGERLSYESATAGNQADLIDALHAATADQHAALEQLAQAQGRSARARAALDRKRTVVTALVAEQQRILGGVQGQLKVLVADAEMRRSAAAAAALHAAAVRAAAKAHEAAPPAAPSPKTSTRLVVHAPAPRQARPHAKRRLITARAGAQRPRPPQSSTVPQSTTPATTLRTAPMRFVGPVEASPVAPEPPSPAAVPIEPTVPAPPAAGDVISWARTRLGSPYVWGAAGPSTFDCSGLVLWSFAQAGRGILPHSSQAMYAMSLHLPLSALRPGDLVFFGQPVHHVGIYIGGGNMIDALNSRTPVTIHSIYGISEAPLAGRL